MFRDLIFTVNLRLTYGRGETRGRYCGTAEFCAWRGLSLSSLVTGTDWYSKTTQKRGRVKEKGERKERCPRGGSDGGWGICGGSRRGSRFE